MLVDVFGWRKWKGCKRSPLLEEQPDIRSKTNHQRQNQTQANNQQIQHNTTKLKFTLPHKIEILLNPWPNYEAYPTTIMAAQSPICQARIPYPILHPCQCSLAFVKSLSHQLANIRKNKQVISMGCEMRLTIGLSSNG